jgi:ribosome biogenesis GTPase / thiamine phosphate phosphatase
VPARVIGQQRNLWRVAGDVGECWAAASGKLRLTADAGGEWPAVGDWVALEAGARSSPGLIQVVLPRHSCFTRKEAGKRIAEQVLAANVDFTLLVCGLDGDFNPRRVERYLAQCWESGARPVVLLNKADVCENVTAQASQVERISMGAKICVISAKTSVGFEELAGVLRPGLTFALLGSSGAGKSTIANRLLEQEAQKTREVREADSRGRHTTTARELFVLPGGALLMDTPGLRELQLWDAAEGVARAFEDIEGLAAQCRFRDCRHEQEPGCAVRRAVQEGTLEEARLENRAKLLREQEFLVRKVDTAARATEKERIKSIHRGARQKYKQRERDGGKR